MLGGNYARQWVDDRVRKICTRELYDGLPRNHLSPYFGKLSLVELDEVAERRWRKVRLES